MVKSNGNELTGAKVIIKSITSMEAEIKTGTLYYTGDDTYDASIACDQYYEAVEDNDSLDTGYLLITPDGIKATNEEN